jgi:hypothetical protein
MGMTVNRYRDDDMKDLLAGLLFLACIMVMVILSGFKKGE